jgi:hypothetical protein
MFTIWTSAKYLVQDSAGRAKGVRKTVRKGQGQEATGRQGNCRIEEAIRSRTASGWN